VTATAKIAYLNDGRRRALFHACVLAGLLVLAYVFVVAASSCSPTPAARRASRPCPIPLWLRLPVAVLVLAWGARTDRLWTVPLAATLGAARAVDRRPVMLFGCWPLLRHERRLARRYDAGHGATVPARASAAG